ncbi:MAG: hypothetical protein Kow0098_11280 [Ignavibacteriaceae bacterium]
MSLKDELISYCHKVYKMGFVSAYDGNLSVVTDKNTFLITRSGVCKGEIKENDILEIDASGKILNGTGRVSTEYKIHLYAYSKRPEVNAVVHCHPVYATAFATAGKSLSDNLFPEVILSLGKVPLCRYATPSTEDLPKTLDPFIEYAWAFLLQNHGAVTLGKSLEDAYYKMEKLEHSAKIILLARLLGGEKPIPPSEVNKLVSIAKETYGIEQDERNVF